MIGTHLEKREYITKLIEETCVLLGTWVQTNPKNVRKKYLEKQNIEFSKGSHHSSVNACTQGVPTYPCTQAKTTLLRGS